ncbi:LPD38 domain-containing protein [Aeromonas caviae]
MSERRMPTYEDFLRQEMRNIPQPDPEPTSDQGVIGDTVDMFQRGVGQTFGGDAETLGQLTDSQAIKDAGRAISDWGEGQMQEVSPEMRAAMGKQFVVENPDGSISAGEAWADPRAYWGNFATVLGQFAGLIGGTKGAGVVAKPLIRGMANRLATDLVEGEAKRLVAKATVKDALKSGTMDSVRAAYAAAPTAVAKKAVIDKAVGQLAFIGYGAHAGAMASGMRAQQAERDTRTYLNSLSPDALNNNGDYQDAYWSLADGDMNGADPSEIRKAAISYLSEQTASDAFQDPRALASDFASGLLTGAGGGIGGVLGKVGQTRTGAAVRGLVGEGATEGWQGAETQRAVNEAVQEWADETRDPLAGVLVAGLNEAIIGGFAGGALAGVAGPEVHINKPVVRTVTGNERIDGGINQLDQRQAERGAAIEREIDTLFAGKQNPLGASDQAFDPVRDIPAYERQGFVRGSHDFKGTEIPGPLEGELLPQETGLMPLNDGTDLIPQGGSAAQDLADLAGGRMPPSGRHAVTDQRLDGDLMPQELGQERAGLPGATIEGDGREVGTELPYRDFIVGEDGRPAQRRAADIQRRGRELADQPAQIGQSDTIFVPGEPGADTRNSEYTPPRLSRDQVDRTLGEESTRDPRSPVSRAIANAGSATDSVFGPLQSLRVTKRGKPFASQKEAQLASRADEQPVALNGGGFGIANRGEVEQAKAADQVTDFADRPTINVSGDSVTVPSSAEGAASQPQTEVRDEQIAPVSSISGEGQSDQPGAGVPTAAGAEPAITGFADGAGAGDRADLAAPAPVPDGQQQDDPTLTAPATDAGAAVSGRIGEEELRDRDLLKEHGGHWKYRSAVGAGWFTANTKEAAIERAEEAYRKAVSKGEPVPTRDERFAQADAELFSEMDRRYGKMSTPELEAEYQRLGGEVGDLQKSGSGEFNGNGGRRTGAAVSNEGARQVGEERLRLGVYMKMRRDRDTAGSGAKSQQIEPANDWRGAKSATDYHAAAPSVPRSGDASAAKGAGGVTEGRLELDGVSIRIPAIDEKQQRLYNQATHRGQGVNFASGISTGVGRILNDLKDAGLLDTAEQRAAAEAEVQAWANEEAINARKLMRDGIKNPSWAITGRSGHKAQSSAAQDAENRRQAAHHKDQSDRITALRGELKKLRPKEVIGKESFNYAWGKAKGMIADYASAQSNGQPNLLASLRKSMNAELARYLQSMGKIDAPNFIKTLKEQDQRLKAAGHDGLVAIVGARSNPGKIISNAIDGRIRFSKQAMAQGDKPAKHLTRKEAELVAREWFKQYRGASGIDVQIHATQEALENALGLDAKDGLIRRAAFDDDAGTLHVAADTISDAKRMREILRHEVLAHYGLANVLGDGEYTKLMSRLIQSQKDPSMKAVWDWVNTHYADEDIGTQAEEVVAHLAELEQGAWGRGWDRVVAWVTRALRAVGFVPDGITAAETRSLLEGLGRKLQRSGPDDSSPDGGKKFSQEEATPAKKGGVKMSQADTAAEQALGKLNLGAKPDIIDKTRASLDKLRKVERGMVKSWLDRFVKKANTEVLDALAPIKYAEDEAGVTDAADSGYVAARMATGAASTMQATMLYGLPEWRDGVIQRKEGTGEKDALLGIFSDLGKDLHNWLGWMAGHRAELLMEQGRENLLSEQDIAALKGLGKGKEAKFMEAKARWNRLNAATLDLAQEAGLFTPEARAEFESEWYIPFFRESDDGDAIAPFKPKGIANQNAGIKKLKGGEANTNDLLENIFTSTSKLIDASMKNMAAQKTVWNLADTGLIDVVAKPNMMDWRALKNGKDLIAIKMDGEDYMIRVNDPDLYRAMTFFDRQPFGAMVNVAAKAKRLLTAGVTASPEFMLRNFLRDSLSSWAISKDGFKPVIDSIKGVKKTLAMEGSTLDVMFSGASFLGGYVNGNDQTAMADSVRKSLRRKGMTPEQIAKYEKSIVRNAAQVKGVVADVWDKYSRYGEALENANREAVYEAAIKAGKSHAQAAFESKDLMDFSMLGAARFIQGASMVLPFFNARIQGLGKLSRELRDNPREIAKRAGMITAMSLGLLALNWDDERYEELPDWDKDANWHFFIGDQHFRIPKPFEIGVMFGTIPERMARAMGGKDTGAQFGKAVARAVGETFALNPTPQIVKPLVESYFNYDAFRGGPIENAQDLAVQAEARYNEQTSLMMRELGEATGMSPKKLEHLLIGYTGTIGSYVMAAADGLIRAGTPGESASWRADEILLVKAVYRGSGPAKSTQHMEEFYRMLNEVNQLKRTVDQYRSEGLTDKANELLNEQGGILKSRRSLSQTQQQVRVVRNKIELIQRDRTMSADEKRRRIDGLLSRRNDLVYQAVNKNRQNWE